MEGQPQKRINESSRDEFSIPQELLCKFFSYLDARSLCTIRLANKQFSQLASEPIKILRVDCQSLEGHPDTRLLQFPSAEVQAYNAYVGTLPLLGAQHVRGLITSIEMAEDVPPPVLPADEERIAVLSQLPRLAFFSTTEPVRIFASLPANLRALSLGRVETTPDMMALSRLTGLTRLELSNQLRAVRPLNLIGRLPQLKHLTIECFGSMLPCIAPLSNLESLVWRRWIGVWEQYNEERFQSWNPITRLKKLTSLCVEGSTPFRPDLEELSVLTGLECLSLRGLLTSTGMPVPPYNLVNPSMCFELASFLDQFPRLTELAIPHFQSIDPIFKVMPTGNLRSLDVYLDPSQGADIVGTLGACTRLTHLGVKANPLDFLPEYAQTVGTLTTLRSLSLDGWEIPIPCPPLEQLFPALMGVTALTVRGWGFSDQHVAACTALTGLRELHLESEQLVTQAAVPHLTGLSWLAVLELIDTHVRPRMVTPDVFEGCNQARRALGWPPLPVRCRVQDPNSPRAGSSAWTP